VSSGSLVGPFAGIEGKDPFWSMGIFRRDLFGVGSGVETIISPVISKISSSETIPFTTAYYFPGTDTSRYDHILTIPIEMAHHTNTTSVHTEITTVSLTQISTPCTPNVTPTLPPGYRELNASIPTPT
jgi:hypothetical protein